jgi:hypothetical protein
LRLRDYAAAFDNSYYYYSFVISLAWLLTKPTPALCLGFAIEFKT